MNKAKKFLEMTEEDIDNFKSMFPLEAVSGVVDTAKGEWLLKVNRTGGRTGPLASQVDCNGLIRYLVDHLNRNQNEVMSYLLKYRKS